jgi:hypothetical protein
VSSSVCAVGMAGASDCGPRTTHAVRKDGGHDSVDADIALGFLSDRGGYGTGLQILAISVSPGCGSWRTVRPTGPGSVKAEGLWRSTRCGARLEGGGPAWRLQPTLTCIRSVRERVRRR